jgi:hypothetical protein
MAASNTRFTQNSLGQSKTPIDSDHGIYRYSGGYAPGLGCGGPDLGLEICGCRGHICCA